MWCYHFSELENVNKKTIESKKNGLQQFNIFLEFLSFYREQSKWNETREIDQIDNNQQKSMKFDTHNFFGD